ncbi:MAG TPA: RuBisCO large subunit C-terminal-like domain-containing protein [Nitrospira sp.]|nr:RuBisCO large subunit C-terminal-like domain-containing protein [Nitrospira sp.]
MTGGQHDSLATEFLRAIYEVDGPETEARAQAERICLDQTIEADADLLPPPLRANILGRLERLRSLDEGRYEATIRYPGDLVGNDHSDLLNLLFGMTSLRTGARLVSFTLTKGLLSLWRGPRYGLAGLRQAVGAFNRSLVCAVLKPLGRSPNELAKLATQFVRGGADLIKDDQALLDQPICPFNERVARCAEAIVNASAERGRPCLYFAHISGALESMRRRAAQAKRLGATGLLVAPGLTGFDALRALVEDQTLTLPVASHPSFLGACVSRSSGLAPAVAYALLPRLAGADLTIYPRFDAGYLMSKEECQIVAANSRQPWEHIQPTMPAVGGRMGVESMAEMSVALGPDTVFVLGSRIQQDEREAVGAIEEFQRRLRDVS